MMLNDVCITGIHCTKAHSTSPNDRVQPSYDSRIRVTYIRPIGTIAVHLIKTEVLRCSMKYSLYDETLKLVIYLCNNNLIMNTLIRPEGRNDNKTVTRQKIIIIIIIRINNNNRLTVHSSLKKYLHTKCKATRIQSYTEQKKLLYTSLITTGNGLKISIAHSSISDNKNIQKISFRNLIYNTNAYKIQLCIPTAHKQR